MGKKTVTILIIRNSFLHTLTLAGEIVFCITKPS